MCTVKQRKNIVRPIDLDNWFGILIINIYTLPKLKQLGNTEFFFV